MILRQSSQPTREVSTLANETILWVDNNWEITQCLAPILAEESGLHVVCINDGLDALRSASTEPPDLILLAMLLPSVGGLDVLRALKRDPRTEHIPVIVVTADMRTQAAECLDLGASDFILKPFRLEELIARICGALLGNPRRGPASTDV